MCTYIGHSKGPEVVDCWISLEIHRYKNLNFKTQQSTCQTILEINPRSKERLSYLVELSFSVEN